MKRFQSHKNVQAARIVALVDHRAEAVAAHAARMATQPTNPRFRIDEKLPHVDPMLDIEMEGGEKYQAHLETQPQLAGAEVGWYFMRYDDGCVSCAPAATFEAGHSVATEPETDVLPRLRQELLAMDQHFEGELATAAEGSELRRLLTTAHDHIHAAVAYLAAHARELAAPSTQPEETS